MKLESKPIATLSELSQEAEALVQSLAPKATGATLVTLSGNLGAGKTTFVQAVAKALGVPHTVTSPTFVLQKQYPLPEGAAFAQLIHIDAYRLSGGSELAPLAFGEKCADTGNLIMLEWPENVRDALPAADVSIVLEARPDGTRTLSYA